MQKPPVDDFISILETFLVEWKQKNGNGGGFSWRCLETFLVEWKRSCVMIAEYPYPLETFLVEWKLELIVRAGAFMRP